MPTTEAQNRAKIKYRKKTYDRVEVTIPKGLRERWKAVADAKGISLTSLVVQAMEAVCVPVEAGNQFDNIGEGPAGPGSDQ